VTGSVRGRGRALAALLVGTTLVLAGCGPSDDEGDAVTHPEGSRALVLNQPTPIGDYRVVASNVTEDAAGIDVVSDGAAEGDRVSLGDEATIGGFTFTLVDIVLDEKDSAPGGSGTTVWILPAE
jgi:hypothetical protein